MAGYQQEVYKYFNLAANAQYLLSDAIPSVSTAVGTKTISDGQGHWSTQSAFGRLNYNFDEKYFIEGNFRADDQNVSNYLYVPTMPISQSLWLFGNKQLWTVGTPNLTSIDLTWEKVSTFDVGADFRLLNDRLSGSLDWYEAYTTDLVGPGPAVPVVLGAAPPHTKS